MSVTWLELGSGFLLITLALPLLNPQGGALAGAIVLPGVRDATWLMVLAIFCTLIPFAVALGTLRYLSAFTTQLAVNLEPVYAIALAVIFLGEARELDALFYVGVLIVIAAVFGHGWLATGRITR
jgi:drug/metabolite transporter (DMT)-like permease